MVRPCPPTLALPSAFVSGVKWAGKIPNISLESSSQTAGTITEQAAAPGTEAYETHHTCVLSAVFPVRRRTAKMDQIRSERSAPLGRVVAGRQGRSSQWCHDVLGREL